MYSPGKILYFDPFYFKNGNTSKAKYFIVLHNDSKKTIIASLPTRSDHVPSDIPLKHGCINVDSINFNCYHFEAEKAIATNGWGFDLPTFMYGSQVDFYDLEILKDVYKVEGTEYEILGILKKSEFLNIIKCFSKSKSVKFKFRNVFEKMLKSH